VGDLGNALLDQSDWIVESTAVVPGGAGLIVRALTFSLDAEEAERARALVTGQVNIKTVGAFVGDVLGVEGELYAPVRFTRDDWHAADANLLRPLLVSYGDTVDHVGSEEIADLLEELRLPVFASQPERGQKIKDIGQSVQGVIGAVGTVGHVIGGHVGPVLVLISEIGISVVAVGTTALIAGLDVWDRLKRRRAENKAAKAAAAAAREREERERRERKDEEETRREVEQALRDQHDRVAAKQARLKLRAPKIKLEKGPEKPLGE
jgi:ribosomal protein L12E/L44/L45/RPP1/RPP2